MFNGNQSKQYHLTNKNSQKGGKGGDMEAEVISASLLILNKQPYYGVWC